METNENTHSKPQYDILKTKEEHYFSLGFKIKLLNEKWIYLI